MAKMADVVRKLMKDVSDLKTRVTLLENMLCNTLEAKAAQKAPEAPQDAGDDAWDPSTGPMPASLKRAGSPAVAHEDRVALHNPKKKNR